NGQTGRSGCCGMRSSKVRWEQAGGGEGEKETCRRRSLRTDLAQNRSRLGRRIGGFRDRPPGYGVASPRGDRLGGGNDTDLVGNVSASGAYSRSDDGESLPEF